MQQIYLNKLQTWRPGLLLAGLLALALLYPLRTAAEGGPSATDGGAAEIGTVGGSHNNQSTGPLISGDPYVGWYSDAWEVTLYVGDYKGSYMLFGDETLKSANIVSESERENFIKGINWMKSDGKKHIIDGTVLTGHKIYDKETPQWSEREEIVAWGTGKDEVQQCVSEPLLILGILQQEQAGL